MSVIEIHNKSEAQPWMAYRCGMSPSRALNCCSSLFTDTTMLLPFQIIATAPFESFEMSPYGADTWTEVALTIHEELIDGFWVISYHGDLLASELTCGTYDVRLTAGEVWEFEPITVKDFEITTNAFTIKDDLFLPFEFLETQVNNVPIFAPVDSFLPFMYATSNPTTVPEYYIVDSDGTETLLTIVVDVKTINGKTYYIYESACFYPFLNCGNYFLKIVDGLYTYYSVWFHAEANINDIPDGYRASLDADNKIVLDDNCNIIIDSCITPDITMTTTKADTFTMTIGGIGVYYIYWGDGTSEAIVLTGGFTSISHIYVNGGNVEIFGVTTLTLLYVESQSLTSFYISAECELITELLLNGNNLTSINDILINLDAMNRNDQDIDLSGGTNATHSGDGTTAYNNLIGRGNNVTTN